MNRWFTILLIITLLSCKDFNLKKQSADEILQEELKSINWEEVDFYPTFENCKGVTSKAKSKTCFETEVKKAIKSRLSQQDIKTSQVQQDTVLVHLFIAADGNTSIKKISISEQIENNNPELESWLKEAVNNLPEVYPAQKRSVPVSLHTQIPIILE